MIQPVIHSAEPMYSTFGLDPEMSDLVEMFVDEMPDRLANFCDCMDRNDMEAVCIAAHQLKGAAGSYGFGELTPSLHHLEMALKRNASADEIQLALDAVIALCERIRPGGPA